MCIQPPDLLIYSIMCVQAVVGAGINIVHHCNCAEMLLRASEYCKGFMWGETDAAADEGDGGEGNQEMI